MPFVDIRKCLKLNKIKDAQCAVMDIENWFCVIIGVISTPTVVAVVAIVVTSQKLFLFVETMVIKTAV